MSQFLNNMMVPTRVNAGWTVLLLIFFAITGCHSSSPEIQNEAPTPIATRIISTTPAITETVLALGLEERLIAVSQFCAYLDEVRQLPKVGGLYNPNIEQMIRLNPDLVIVDTGASDLAARLHSLGIHALVVDSRSLEGIYLSIIEIGKAGGTDSEQRARDLVRHLEDKLHNVKVQTENLARPSVLLVLDRPIGDRRFSSFYAAGNSTLFNDLLEVAGGKNILADSPLAVVTLSLEALLELNPDFVLDLSTNESIAQLADEVRPQAVEQSLADWATLSERLTAVRQGHVHPLLDHWATVPGPHIHRLAEAMAVILHPEIRPSDPLPAPSEDDQAAATAPGHE